MRLDKYITQSRIIELKATDFSGALAELLSTFGLPTLEGFDREQILSSLMEREGTMTTCLGAGVALPHIRLPIKKPFMIAVGHCPNGLDYEGIPNYRDLRVLVLLIISTDEPSYLNALAALARSFQEGSGIERLIDAPNLTSFREGVKSLFGASKSHTQKTRTRFNHSMIKQAEKVAHGADCSTILVFSDTFSSSAGIDRGFDDFKTVLVTEKTTPLPERRNVHAIINVRSFNHGRLSQVRSAVIIGLTRGIFKYNERLCCLGGIPGSDQFDTIVVLDLEREFQSVFNRKLDILPQAVQPEVVERVLAIATELSVEGREGKPIGTLFVVGDTEHVRPFTKPLVINPFYGYKEEDRNILNPFMDETVKEFSSIDGAFIIRGDGVIESAGSFIHAPNHDYQLPGGLGTRHSAGAAISLVTDCLAVVISSSGRQVTLFRKGQMLPLIEKGDGLNF